MGDNHTGDDYINTAQNQILYKWEDLSPEEETPRGIHVKTRGKTLSGEPMRREIPTGYFINQDQLCGDFTEDQNPSGQIMCGDYL